MYKSRCGLEFETVAKLGAHSHCSICRNLKLEELKIQNKCIVCGTLTKNKKCCSKNCVNQYNSLKRLNSHLSQNVLEKRRLKMIENDTNRKGKKFEDFFKDASTAKDRLKNSLTGRKLTVLHKDNIRNAMKGRIFTPEWKAKIKATTIKNIQNGKYDFKVSKTEVKFLDLTEAFFNIKIERQYIVDSAAYDGRFKNTLIELDGIYWHSLPCSKRGDCFKNYIAQKNKFNLLRINITNLKNVENEFKQNIEKLKVIL